MGNNKEQKFVSIVAYVHNAADLIPGFLDTVMQYAVSLFQKTELILVDDGSTDSSRDVIRAYFDTHPAGYMTSIIRMGRYQGLETSMNAGRDMAIGDYVFEFDDLYVDYPTERIEAVYRRCLSGYDIVSAASSARMRATSRMFYHVYNKVSGTEMQLGQETFRILSRRAINRVKSMGAYIPYRKAVYMNCGLNTDVLTYQSEASNNYYTQHTNRHDRTELAMDSFIYFTNLMEKVSLWVTGFFFVIAIAVIIYVIWSYFLDNHLQSGWVSMMGFLSLGFMGIFGLLSIILKYLSVLLDLVFRHQRYMVEDVEKISAGNEAGF